MSITDKERATLIALANALDSDEPARIKTAAQATLDAAPPSVVHGEVGGVFKAIGRHARRARIRANARTIAEGSMDGRGVVVAMAAVVRAARDLDDFHQRAPGAPHEGERLRAALHDALGRLTAVTIDAAIDAMAVCCVACGEVRLRSDCRRTTMHDGVPQWVCVTCAEPRSAL